MRTPRISPVILFAFGIILLAARCNSGPDDGNGNGIDPVVPDSNGISIVSDTLWIEGRVELAADSRSWGLVGISKTDVFWLPYRLGDGDIDLHDTVYLRIGHIKIDTNTFAVAANVTKTKPAGILCTGNCIQDAWVKKVSLMPHNMFSHRGGATFHRPGHAVSATTPSDARMLQIVENGTVLQTQQYERTLVSYEGDTPATPKDTVYVPSNLLSVLRDPVKFYYLEFYDIRIDNKKVLRTYTIEHSHPGHISNVTIMEQ